MSRRRGVRPSNRQILAVVAIILALLALTGIGGVVGLAARRRKIGRKALPS